MSVNLSPAFPRLATIYSKTDENSDAGKRAIARFNLYVSDTVWWGLLCGGDYNCQGHPNLTVGQYLKTLNPNLVALMYMHSVFTEGWGAPADGRGYTAQGTTFYFDPAWFLTYAGSALSAGVSATDTVLPVKSAAPFTVGDNVLIGTTDVAKITAITNGALQVTRGQWAQGGRFPAVRHSSAAWVRPIAHAFGSQDFLAFNPGSRCPTSNVNTTFGAQTFNQFQASFWALKLQEPFYSNLDGVFLDNFVTAPAIYDNNTALDFLNQNAATATGQAAYFAAGMADTAARMRAALGPEKIVVGNTGGAVDVAGASLNGGIIEGVDAAGNNSYVGDVLAFYNSWVAHGQRPTTFIYDASGQQTNYQAMRYGLACALQSDGFFCYDEVLVSGGHQTSWWYDEYDNAGQGTGYLGQPLGSPSATVAPGVRRRDFERGIALVNDSTAAQTIQLGGTFRKIAGTQAPAVNDGSLVAEVTLQPRDGLILLRTDPLLSGLSDALATATALQAQLTALYKAAQSV